MEENVTEVDEKRFLHAQKQTPSSTNDLKESENEDSHLARSIQFQV